MKAFQCVTSIARIALLLVLIMPATSSAQRSLDPWFGTWVLGQTELSMTSWEDGIKILETRPGEGGRQIRVAAFARLDGHVYPETGPDLADGLTLNRIDDRTYEYVGTKDGAVVNRSLVNFPFDGVTRVSRITLLNGEQIDRTSIWKRKQVAGSEPWFGTWQTGNTSFVMEPWEDGFLISYSSVPAAPGHTGSHGSVFGRFDGRHYRETGSATTDDVIFKKIDPRTIALVHFKGDKETVTVTMTFALDGKSRISRTTGTEANGTTVNRSVTWTRVEP